MFFFDHAQVILIFRAFRRDDTPEMANLKADEAWPASAWPVTAMAASRVRHHRNDSDPAHAWLRAQARRALRAILAP
jgi:hypothetical protein